MRAFQREETCVFRLRDGRVCGIEAQLAFDYRVPLCGDHETVLLDTLMMRIKWQAEDRLIEWKRSEMRTPALKAAIRSDRAAELQIQRNVETATLNRRIDRIETSRRDQGSRLVYYVQRPDGAIKIGTTWNIRTRLQAFRNVSPVQLLAVHSGGQPAEAALHRKFKSARLDGEWFRPDPALLRHIDHTASVWPVVNERPTGRRRAQEEDAA